MAVLVVSYASSVRGWFEQRGEIAAAQQQIRSSRAAVERLSRERQRWRDPAYVKAQARERFGWVMPGQIGFRVIDKAGNPLVEGAPLDTTAVAASRQHPDWWTRVWGSMQAAGRPSTPATDRPEHRVPATRIGPGGRPSDRTARDRLDVHRQLPDSPRSFR